MNSPTYIRIGEFCFDPTTGELKKRESPPDEQSVRIPPQPAQLLKLMIDCSPGIITREEIQQALWPGVTSEIDRNVHFCVRQVRSAFGDSASAPKYIETIPRRGYRLIAEVSSVVGAKLETSESAEISPKSSNTEELNLPDVLTESIAPTNSNPECREGFGDSLEKNGTSISSRNRIWIAMLVSITTLVLISLATRLVKPKTDANDKTGGTTIAKVRVAIMPFKSDKPGFEVLGNGEIALSLLEHFSSDFQTYEMVGPSTTEPFVAAQKSIREMVDDVRPDLVVNGKFVSSDNEDRLLVEIIRADDGSHIWVKYFNQMTNNTEISRMTSMALREKADELIQDNDNLNAE